ncbi:MAG: COX15/CtaA family protein [Ardenticatenales bacterium]|nr:COX15/CtaA family protein [Ardenticatenales bacterium]
MTKLSRYATFSWGVLLYTIFVILWGAFVRATHSGAGCGSHWPLCNGEVIPQAPQIETIIEFTHRLSSGLALPMVLVMAVWAYRAFPKGHPVRGGAMASLFLMVTEAIIGAGLVLFELVAYNSSVARAYWMIAHLSNTFLLLAALTLTAWWASGGPAVRLKGQGRLGALLGGGVLCLMLLGASGAIAALGDTLFPATSLAEGLQQDFAPTAHLFLRLRLFHPAIAVGTALYLVIVAALASAGRPTGPTRSLAQVLVGLILLQMSAGLLNVALLAPVWLQIVHLLLADLLWMVLILLTASTLSHTPVQAQDPFEGQPLPVLGLVKE